jgi:hypothetical protein
VAVTVAVTTATAMLRRSSANSWKAQALSMLLMAEALEQEAPTVPRRPDQS